MQGSGFTDSEKEENVVDTEQKKAVGKGKLVDVLIKEVDAGEVG